MKLTLEVHAIEQLAVDGDEVALWSPAVGVSSTRLCHRGNKHDGRHVGWQKFIAAHSSSDCNTGILESKLYTGCQSCKKRKQMCTLDGSTAVPGACPQNCRRKHMYMRKVILGDIHHVKVGSVYVSACVRD